MESGIKIAEAVCCEPLTDEEIERRHAEQRDREEKRRRATIWEEFIDRRGTRYQDCQLSNYEVNHEEQAEVVAEIEAYLRDFESRVKAGVSVLLFGPAGTGKDHLLAAMMKAALWRYGRRIDWRNGIDLYGDVRDRIGSDQSESGLIRSLVKPDILAISDPLPPTGKLTEFQMQTLFRVIDGRYSNRKPTWVTLNVNKSREAKERMGAQVVDRLSHDALVAFCDWPSYRSNP
jgi:DNA replication protein DnaC